jgi:hypothetical protein
VSPLAVVKPRVESRQPRDPFARVTPGSQAKNQPRDAARAQRTRLSGVDLVAVTGLAASMAQTILAAVNPDMPQCPPSSTAAHGWG